LVSKKLKQELTKAGEILRVVVRDLEGIVAGSRVFDWRGRAGWREGSGLGVT